jgi:hypothetical protein
VHISALFPSNIKMKGFGGLQFILALLAVTGLFLGKS